MKNPPKFLIRVVIVLFCKTTFLTPSNNLSPNKLIEIGSFYNKMPVKNRKRLITILNNLLKNSQLSSGQSNEIIGILTLNSLDDIKRISSFFNTPKNKFELISNSISLSGRLIKFCVFINSGVNPTDLLGSITNAFIFENAEQVLLNTQNTFCKASNLLTDASFILERELVSEEGKKCDLADKSVIEDEIELVQITVMDFVQKSDELLEEGVADLDKILERNVEKSDNLLKEKNGLFSGAGNFQKIMLYGTSFTALSVVMGICFTQTGGVSNILNNVFTSSNTTNNSPPGLRIGNLRIMNEKL
jgi:hypothetical protein